MKHVSSVYSVSSIRIRCFCTLGIFYCRPAWSLYNPEERRLAELSFEDGLTLRFNKASAYSRRAMQHYDVRNPVVHGALRSERIDVSSVIREFYLIHSPPPPS